MSNPTISWRTNWFRVLDSEKLQGSLLLPDCESWTDDQGRIQLSAWDQSTQCFLVDDSIQVEATSIESAGGIPNKELDSYDSTTGEFEDLFGFEFLDAFLPAGEVVVLIDIGHLDGNIGGNAYAWQKGMDEPLQIRAFDIFELVEAKLGITKDKLHW